MARSIREQLAIDARAVAAMPNWKREMFQRELLAVLARPSPERTPHD